MVKRIKLELARGVAVEFTDRNVAIEQSERLAERGTRLPLVVFGPEGCGKSAWLRQTAEVLKEHDYSVVLVSPLARGEERLVLSEELRELARSVLPVIIGEPATKLVDNAIDLLYKAMKRKIKRRMAILLDEVFQAVGVNRAAVMVKGLLNMIEYPPVDYERVVAIAATSEGISRREIGRHEWANIIPMWNMPREGFKQLYDKIPGEKPSFDEVWRLTGGNPRLLGELYEEVWDARRVVRRVADRRRISAFVSSLTPEERRWLEEAVEEPDTLFTRERMSLMDKLVELNLLVDTLPERDEHSWIDQPPPERDPELGIGKYVAWQTPSHKEAMRRALEVLTG